MSNEWKELEIDNYFISNNGTILRKYKNGKTKELKPAISPDGYLRVCLSCNDQKKSYSVARLTAKAFIINDLNKETVNHIDGNKLNNNIDNLEWCTKYENTMHALRNGLHSKILRPVNVYDSDGVILAECESCREASRLTGLDHSTILRSLKYEPRTIKGYQFVGMPSLKIPPEAIV